MVCIQVFGHNAAIGFAGSSGAFELNVFTPVIGFDMLTSICLLADAMASFETHCARGIEPSRKRITDLMERSLMLVTALALHIGYDALEAIAKAALASGKVTAEEFDRWMVPSAKVWAAAGAARKNRQAVLASSVA